MTLPLQMEVVDSHTEGEPTRVVVAGWPEIEGRTMATRREAFARTHDALRRAVVAEPRGHEAMVGALLTAPVEASSEAGAVFFDNAGTLGMCGHGLMGVARTLQFLGRVGPGKMRVDTPVGTVFAEIGDDGTVTIENIPAFVHEMGVTIEVPGAGPLRGDVAWGGNWFFVTQLGAPSLDLANVRELVALAAQIRRALAAARVTGAGGAEIDHVELCGPPHRADADSRNFVLCPGLAYDRSPCGTGTSARMAVLAARGMLRPRQVWRQESITGSLFTGWLEERGSDLVPFVKGRAFVTARSTLFFDPRDPFRAGFPEVV